CHLLIHISFFPDAPPPQTYPLSLHDALPISVLDRERQAGHAPVAVVAGADLGLVHAQELRLGEPGDVDLNAGARRLVQGGRERRSEEHTSELQSRENLVCRLLLEKKKKKKKL